MLGLQKTTLALDTWAETKMLQRIVFPRVMVAEGELGRSFSGSIEWVRWSRIHFCWISQSGWPLRTYDPMIASKGFKNLNGPLNRDFSNETNSFVT